MAGTDFTRWPALQGAEWPKTLEYERGVWGKMHGARSDFRWIACSEDFAPDPGLEREFYLGSQDQPRRLFFWRCPSPSQYFAGTAYPSRATDAAGRGGSLEKQILKWASKREMPAALAALLLLPHIRSWGDGIWWSRREEQDWSLNESRLSIGKSDCQGSVPSDIQGYFDKAFDKGLEELKAVEASYPGELARCYARLLAGEKPACLYIADPLGPEALATLLLPLERTLADGLSLAGWTPSERYELEELGKLWDVLVLPRAAVVSKLSEAAEHGLPKAATMVRALFENRPEWLAGTAENKREFSGESVMQLAIWGPSSSGKTVLMAQLYLDLTQIAEGEWNIYATHEKTEGFIRSMRSRRLANHFPLPTADKHKDQVSYRFRHKTTGIEAGLVMEDRAGKSYENREADGQQSIKSAVGVVLLIDPSRESWKLQEELSDVLMDMNTDRAASASDPRDPRPIAVCVSKADELIETSADFHHARAQPEAFAKDYDYWDLVPLFDRFCTNYRLFPVSAVGIELRHGIVEANTFYDENLILRIKTKTKSFNLMEPFDWLIEQLSELPRP